VVTVLATEWSFGSVIWTMVVLFFWVMAIWIFIAIFADIFRRNDLSGWGKAGWILLIFIVPFLGALIYVIARPKMTAQDKEMMEQAQEAQRRVSGYSPADEIAKLAELRDKGEISADEYNDLKRKATMQL
jgi:type VI protein secretion system component VasK